jgi:uncharacterized protein (DUF58 family)
MHLAPRAYVLLLLTALLGISGLWSDEPLLINAWLWPAIVLTLGLLYEAFWTPRQTIAGELQNADRLYLGRPQIAQLCVSNASSRTLKVEVAPAVPAAFLPLGEPRVLSIAAGDAAATSFELQAQRLGQHAWPSLPARVLGPLSLAWWSRQLAIAAAPRVAPDSLREFQQRARGMSAGMRARRVRGVGAELYNIRDYRPGDPLNRIDWKVSARAGRLATREYSDDQHLDIVVAIDAGRLSRIRAGQLDRIGLYANVAARFAQLAIAQDDRIGFYLFADRGLAFSPPQRGLAAVAQLRGALEQLHSELTEPDPLAAALHLRATLRQRSLVVVLTDLNDSAVFPRLARGVRLLAERHVPIVAGVRNADVAALLRAEPQSWRDPWIALAAADHDKRTDEQAKQLRALGVSVIACEEALLERRVIEAYDEVRRQRRI